MCGNTGKDKPHIAIPEARGILVNPGLDGDQTVP